MITMYGGANGCMLMG